MVTLPRSDQETFPVIATPPMVQKGGAACTWKVSRQRGAGGWRQNRSQHSTAHLCLLLPSGLGKGFCHHKWAVMETVPFASLCPWPSARTWCPMRQDTPHWAELRHACQDICVSGLTPVILVTNPPNTFPNAQAGRGSVASTFGHHC